MALHRNAYHLGVRKNFLNRRWFFKTIALVFLTSILSTMLLSQLSSYANKQDLEKSRSGVVELIRFLPIEDYSEIEVGPVAIGYTDTFSDCVTLGVVFSTSEVPFGSRPSQAKANEVSSPCSDLRDLVESEFFTETPYSRFWHGSSAILRIASQHLRLESFRVTIGVLNLVMLMSLSILTALVYRAQSVPVILFLLCGSDFIAQGFSLSHSLSVLTSTLVFLIIVAFPKIRTGPLLALSTIGGVLYAYLAQLFYPLAFAVLLYVLVANNERNPKTNAKEDQILGALRPRLAFLSWVLGYGLTMAARFIEIASVEGLSSSLGELRSAASTKGLDGTSTLGPIIHAVYSHLIGSLPEYNLRFFAIVGLAAYAGFSVSRSSCSALRSVYADTIIVLGTVAIWYGVMGTHSGHGWVSNLTLSTFVFAVWLLGRDAIHPTSSGVGKVSIGSFENFQRKSKR